MELVRILIEHDNDLPALYAGPEPLDQEAVTVYGWSAEDDPQRLAISSALSLPVDARPVALCVNGEMVWTEQDKDSPAAALTAYFARVVPFPEPQAAEPERQAGAGRPHPHRRIAPRAGLVRRKLMRWYPTVSLATMRAVIEAQAATPIGRAQDALLQDNAPRRLEPDEYRCGGPGCDGRCCQPVSCPYCNAPIVGWSDSGPA